MMYPLELHIPTSPLPEQVIPPSATGTCTDHSCCSTLYEPLWGVGKEKAGLISEIRLEFLPFAGIRVAMSIEGISVVFLLHWSWDNLFTLLQGTRAARICSLECTDVSGISVYTSGIQHADNYVCPLTTTRTSPYLFLLDPLPAPGFLFFFPFPFSLFLHTAAGNVTRKFPFFQTCSQL